MSLVDCRRLLLGYAGVQNKQVDQNTTEAGIIGANEPAASVTCVSIIVQSERLVSMLAVAQRRHRNQAGVVFSLGGRHVYR